MQVREVIRNSYGIKGQVIEMFSLKQKTRRNIENCVSLPFSELVAMDFEDELRLIKPLNGEKVVFSKKKDTRKVGRGNPFLARKRFRTMEEVDKKLMGIYNANT